MPELNDRAPDFTLRSVSGKEVSLSDIILQNGAVIAFICNHCPYVVASARRMAADALTLMDEGFGFAAICANDAERYPADSFDRMKDFAQQNGFRFPYLHDATQSVARAYVARVTPEFFGISRSGTIHYRGRLDSGQKTAPPEDAPRELVEAMRMIAKTGEGPVEQHPAAGCSIKWKP